MSSVELSYCVVNTSQPDLLARGLDAIARERAAVPFQTEVIVLENGSRDGSERVAREHPTVDETIALERRVGKAANDSELLRRGRGRFALLLNEDSELQPGATLALWRALEAHSDAACAGARLIRPDGRAQACAWRFPSPATALAGALLLHRAYTVQSKGERVREVDWCQSSALLVRGEAAARVGYLDEDFFVYSDEVDFARRLRDAGWRSLYVTAGGGDPSRAAVHRRRSRAADRGTRARTRAVHAQAPLADGGRARALADRVELRAAGGRRARPAGTRPATLLASRHRHAAPRARRRTARGGRGIQPAGSGLSVARRGTTPRRARASGQLVHQRLNDLRVQL